MSTYDLDPKAEEYLKTQPTYKRKNLEVKFRTWDQKTQRQWIANPFVTSILTRYIQQLQENMRKNGRVITTNTKPVKPDPDNDSDSDSDPDPDMFSLFDEPDDTSDDKSKSKKKEDSDSEDGFGGLFD